MAFYKCGGGSEKHFYQKGITIPKTTRQKITMGFKPKYVAFMGVYNATAVSGIYDASVTENSYFRMYGTSQTDLTLPRTDDYLGICSIDNDGVTIQSATYGISNLVVIAIG